MMLFKCISFRKDPFLDLGLGTCYKVVLLEQHVVDHKTECPDIDLRAISLLSEYLRGHEYRGADNFFVNLFFDCKAKVTQLVQHIPPFFLQEYIIRLDIPMHNIIFRYELYSSRQLVNNLYRLWFRECTFLIDDLLEISIGTKLENHGYVILSQKTIVNFGREHSVGVVAEGQFAQHVHFAV